MTLVPRLRSAALWLIWLGLATIWVATNWVNWIEGDYGPAVLALLDLGLLFILYFAEGIELAITDLLDKEPSQLRDPVTRRLLSEIQSKSGFFFAQRQVFVVVIISVLSLTTAYDWIQVPFYGRVTSSSATFWFSLLFTTFTVLWFCQVTPKRLAVINSELFLKQSATIWRLIKGISVFGLPDPSETLVRLIQRRSDFAEGRYLLPGRATHYDIAAHLLGFALDRLHTTITIAPDGSGTIRKRMLILFLRGHHAAVYGTLEAAAAFTTMPQMSVLGLYTLPAPERLETVAERLDAIFDGDQVADNLIDQWAGRTEMSVLQDVVSRRHRAQWSVEGQPLPESLWPADGPDAHTALVPMAALLCEVAGEVAPGCFDVSGETDRLPEVMSLPCRTYTVSVVATGSADEPAKAIAVERCDVSLAGPGTEMADETLQLTRAAVSSRERITIAHPLQGAMYTVSWRVFSRR